LTSKFDVVSMTHVEDEIGDALVYLC